MGPRVLLLVLRMPDDPMGDHERRCFAAAAHIPIEALDVWHMPYGAPDAGTLRRYDAVLCGGSGAFSVLDDVDWIRRSIDTLRDVLDLALPAWGSCFAFQGLAVALGGEVLTDPARKELGGTLVHLTEAGRADPLFRDLPDSFWAQEGHKDRVSALPPAVTRLVTGDTCVEQAFKVDGAPFWASQFHPELTREGTLERFRHYRAGYLGAGQDADATLRHLQAQPETPQVAQVLARLVRREI